MTEEERKQFLCDCTAEKSFIFIFNTKITTYYKENNMNLVLFLLLSILKYGQLSEHYSVSETETDIYIVKAMVHYYSSEKPLQQNLTKIIVLTINIKHHLPHGGAHRLVEAKPHLPSTSQGMVIALWSRKEGAAHRSVPRWRQVQIIKITRKE